MKSADARSNGSQWRLLRLGNQYNGFSYCNQGDMPYYLNTVSANEIRNILPRVVGRNKKSETNSDIKRTNSVQKKSALWSLMPRDHICARSSATTFKSIVTSPLLFVAWPMCLILQHFFPWYNSRECCSGGDYWNYKTGAVSFNIKPLFVHFNYGYPIIKWVTATWAGTKVPGYKYQQRPLFPIREASHGY